MFASFTNYFWGTPAEEHSVEPFTITTDMLKKVILRPVEKKKIRKPALARNMPSNNFNLLKINKEQLQEILNVKLKHIEVPERRATWENTHPVLKEIRDKIPLLI